jgi:1-deoxy-D-xylulose-5-phosphate synthase
LTIEDGLRSADAGSALAQGLRDAGLAVPVHIIGVQEGFPPHASRAEILTGAGLDAASVVREVRRVLAGTAMPGLRTGSFNSNGTPSHYLSRGEPERVPGGTP